MTLWRPIFYSILWFVVYFRHRELVHLYVKLDDWAIKKLTLTLAFEQIPLKHEQYLAHLAKHIDIYVAALL